MLRTVIQKLRRPVSSNAIITEIEGLRFIAIAGVLMMHLRTQIIRINPALNTEKDWLFQITKDGGLGVNLFFSISGFILGYPFFRHYLIGHNKVHLKPFYLKRLTRLEPPFIINILLLFVFQMVFVHSSGTELLPHLAATLTYTHVFIYGVWSNINPVTWSLETEIQFYLLAPFIFMGLYRVKKRTVRVLVLLGLILIVNIGHVGTYEILKKWHLHKSLITYLDNFLIGILFLELFCWEGFKEKIKVSFLWDIIGVAAVLAFFGVTSRLGVLLSGILGNTCIFLIFISAFKGTLASRFLKIGIISTIGGMCYTIYLYHYAMFAILSKYTGFLSGVSNKFWVQYLLQGTLIMGVVLVVCSFLFYWFEKPFMVKSWYKRKQVEGTTNNTFKTIQ